MLDLDRNLWFLFALNLAVGLAGQIIQPLFPLYLRNLNATEVEIGFVISMAGFAAMILMLPSGILMDRVGKKRMLLISVILGAIPPFLIASMKDWRMVAPFFMIFNMSFPFFAPARMAIIAETATPENRATLFGLMNIAWPIGGIIGPVLSGYLVDHLGWSYPFLISAAIMAVSLLPTIMLKEKKDTSSGGKETPRKTSLKDRRYLPTLVLFFVLHLTLTIGIGGLNMILPIFLQDQFKLSASLIGLFFTSSNIFSLFTQIPSGLLADRYSRKKLIIISLATISLFIGIWPLIDNWTTLLILYSIAYGLWSMTWPASLALLSDSVPPMLRGSAFGVRLTGVRLGFTIGPMISGYLYGSSSNLSPFLASAIFLALSVPFALFLRENQKKHGNESNLSRDGRGRTSNQFIHRFIKYESFKFRTK
jgi:ACDE family multidrug resistance protein